MATETGTKLGTITHWIGGKGWDGPVERWGDVYDPATGEKQSRVAFADAEVVDAAVAAATRGRGGLARGLARHPHARALRLPPARRSSTRRSWPSS